MRLYRGKNTSNGEWAYGGFHKHLKITPAPIKSNNKEDKREYAYLIIRSGFSDWNMPKPIEAIEVDPKTVGQSLGVRDRYANEVYQHDTLSGILGGCYVDWCDKCKSYQVFTPDGECLACLHDMHWGEFIQLLKEGQTWVIGNIHDNPELLRKEK
jgi:hypothetical protein